MPRSWKKIGTKIERKERKRLERKGYRVTRSSASLGMYDLIAWRVSPGSYGRSSGYLKFIQCKRSRIKSKELRTIKEDSLPEKLKITKEVVLWNKQQRLIVGEVVLQVKGQKN